jgi:hypothetical protein
MHTKSRFWIIVFLNKFEFFDTIKHMNVDVKQHLIKHHMYSQFVFQASKLEQ